MDLQLSNAASHDKNNRLHDVFIYFSSFLRKWFSKLDSNVQQRFVQLQANSVLKDRFSFTPLAQSISLFVWERYLSNLHRR